MLRSRRPFNGAAVALALNTTAAVHAQQPAAPPAATLAIAGDVTKPQTLSASDLKSLPRTTVTVQDEGRAVAYEGRTARGSSLQRRARPSAAELRGTNVVSYVIASARDGYQALFSLAEADPAFTGSQILVADQVDGKPLFDYQGPLRLVAPGDKRGARSVRMLERLEVVRLKK